MGTHLEWADHTTSVSWSYPGDEDFTGSSELKTTALIIGPLVVEGDKRSLIAFAKGVLGRAEAIDWTEIKYSIDLGQRTNEEGYIDSIKLIYRVLVGLDTERVEYKAELDQALGLDLVEIDDSGQNLDTLHDLLIEWEERAEESDLHAYADGESGMYWVTNIPEEG